MVLLIMKLSPHPCYLVLLRPKYYHIFLFLKTCFTKVFTTSDSIQLRSCWVPKLPYTNTQLDEDRNDLTDKI
jgi:hypothetical protein